MPEMIDPNDARLAIEYCYEQGMTDGLPVVPATESYVAEFLSTADRDPDEVVGEMPHLNRNCTVRTVAINAALAGCRPEYFPVVLAACDALWRDGAVVRGLGQSTTGTVPFFIVNGPVRERLGFNSKGNVFGPGFRANATVGRAIRLLLMNAFGLQPHVLDQSTQATPAKYTFCIGENEEDSPFEPLHVEFGHRPEQSTVTAIMCRSCLHMENRHGLRPEHLLYDLADTIARTGVLWSRTTSACVVLGPEHARLLAAHGLSKAEIKADLAARATRSQRDLDQAGKGALSNVTRWRVPRDHPDAATDSDLPASDPQARIPVVPAPEAILVVVAGAPNAGVSSVVELMWGFRPGGGGGRPAIVEIAD
jgi:hypothetical protein